VPAQAPTGLNANIVVMSYGLSKADDQKLFF